MHSKRAFTFIAIWAFSLLNLPASDSRAAVVTQIVEWDLNDGTLRVTPGGFSEYILRFDFSPWEVVPAGDTLELRFVFQNCEKLELRDANVPDGLIPERVSVSAQEIETFPGTVDVEVELLGVSGSVQSNPFTSSMLCFKTCSMGNTPDMTQSSFDFGELVIRLTPQGPFALELVQLTTFLQADLIQINSPNISPDPPQSVPTSGVPLEYSNALDEQIAENAAGTSLETHGPFDPGQTLYTEPIDIAGNFKPRDANDFLPGIESGTEITNQVDALAYGNDVYLKALLQNTTDLLFSITGDAATEAWALIREESDGTLSVEYRHEDLVQGPPAAASFEDLDAVELWGAMDAHEANYFSLQLDAASGTSIFRFDGSQNRVEFISHRRILDAVTQLGYEGEPDDVDVDGLMVNNTGGATCFDGDDVVLFSLRNTLNGNFDGGEIIVLRPLAAPQFLQHGGQIWDTAHDLLARLAALNGGVDPEGIPDVDALEATLGSGPVGVGSLPTPQRIRMVGAWPNPFNPTTDIHFEMMASGRATLTVFDARGRQVTRLLDESLEPGEHTVRWNGRAADGSVASSGVYYAQLRAHGESSTLKLALTK